jgi:hypothetical protein
MFIPSVIAASIGSTAAWATVLYLLLEPLAK